MQDYSETQRKHGKRVAVVPTMGFLHQGHASLITIGRQQADTVITTVFVNPAQFGPAEDFEQYPRDLDRDMAVARQAGSDVVFHPEPAEMYPPQYESYVTVEHVSDTLEGAVRPGHFRGVATVVLKLLHITRPDVAVFGQKDAQQAFILKKMVRDLNLRIEMVVGPIIREEDGLAMSSRNVYLTPDERIRARVLFRALRHAEDRLRQGIRAAETIRSELTEMIHREHPSGIDYVAVVDPETFREVPSVERFPILVALAVRFGKTRLIDNVMAEQS